MSNGDCETTEGGIMHFVAIDVETANASLASICQIGLVRYESGGFKESWKSLINPHEPFDPMNVAIHGIDDYDVRDAPEFPAVFDTVRLWLTDSVAVCHTAFDRAAMSRVCDKYGLPQVSYTWLDSARVARRTWADCAWGGYGLSSLALKLDIEYREHDAEEDARACAEVLMRAIQQTGFDVEAWMERVNWPLSWCHKGLDCPPPNPHAMIHLDGDPDGDLYGNVLVFTGELSIPREEAARLAAAAGCHVDTGVTKHTTMLVVGDQDLTRLAGHERSSKHRKAEELIGRGQLIRILAETDFVRMMRCNDAQ